MIQLFVGSALYIIPFVLAFCFKDIRRGFLAIFVGSAAIDILLGLALQFFGIFSLSTVILCRSVVVIVALLIFFRNYNKEKIYFPKLKDMKVSLFFVLAFALISVELFSVHYFYTGLTTTINGFEAAHVQSYNYPYVSDEWNGVALANYSIRTGNLPLVNPMDEDKPFLNPLVGFYSLSAFLFLLFGLDPLTQYRLMAVLSGILICFLMYVYARTLEKKQFAALVGAMSIPLIINSGNLQGVWAYLPFLGSLIFLISALIAYRYDDKTITLIAISVALVLYPAMIIFVIAFFLGALQIKGEKIKKGMVLFVRPIIAITAGAIVLAVVLFIKSGFLESVGYIGKMILRDNLTNGIPSFPIWKVLSIPMLALGVLGVIDLVRKRKFEIVFPLAIGAFFWALYAFVETIFIIDYPRVVMIFAILFAVPISVGYEILSNFLERKIHIHTKWIHVALLITFFSFLISYPSPTAWSEFVLKSPDGETVAHPASPVTNYLNEEDLRLFEGISEKWFIAPAWKGLTIGSATHNYPLESKEATISNLIYKYSDFMRAGCEDKMVIAEEYNISYVYSDMFSCAGFDEIGSSSEMLYLYKVVR